MAYRNWLQWVDTGGRTRITRFDCGPVAGGALRIAIQNASNAGLIAVTAASIGGPYTEAGAGVYPSVNDAAQLTYQDTGGQNFNIYIPAPSFRLFLSDGITVGGVVWTALNEVLSTGLFNPATGLNVDKFLGGVRVGGNSGY
jgi:hypothetical protein